jgi:hypothetical protein
MALFDFFKKKTTVISKPGEQNEMPPVNKNWLVFTALETRLREMGYTIKRHTQYLALIVSDELEVSVMVVENPENHPRIMQLMVSAAHPQYFPNGIIEHIAGLGNTVEDQIRSTLNNYIHSTFMTIIDGFSDRHNPDLDFITIVNEKEILWHPKLGALNAQGQWDEYPEGEPLYDLLKNEIPNRLTTNKINWLKIYISKNANAELIGECLFNNAPWEAALDKIFNYAKTWEMPGEFKALKQFIVFRRCDKYDEANS